MSQDMRPSDKRSSEEWVHEFQQFIATEGVEPPRRVSDEILSRVRSDLNPPALQVFARLALIHFFVAALVLLICPQFGIAWFDGMGLMALFMRFGEVACSVACGALFLGASGLAASLALRPEEIRTIRETKVLQWAGLALLSIGAFISMGATIVVTFGLAWVVGSVAGGWVTFELGTLLRARLRKPVAWS